MRKLNVEEKWHQQSEAKIEAQSLPYGKERDALVRKARQLETASQINQWLSSPELRPRSSFKPFGRTGRPPIRLP